MNIALVSPYPPSKTTLNEYAYYMVKHLDANERVTSITILTDELPEGQQYGLEDDLSKTRIKICWKFNSLRNALSIRKALKELKPDAVLYNLQFLSFGDAKVAATLGLLSPMLAKWQGIPSVVLLHNIIETVDLDEAGITQNPIMKWIYGKFGNMITRLILQADKVAFTIPKYLDIISKKYKVSNLVHMPHGTFEIPDAPDFHIPRKGAKRIMTFGKFGTYKKVELTIQAVIKLRKKLQIPIEVIIAGTDNPNVKGYLKSMEDKYGHEGDITFTGYVLEEDVPRIFRDCDAVVFEYTSTTGSSGVLHQAGSYGKATILPVLGDLKDLIEEEGYRGEYFEPSNVDSLADAIEKVLVDDNHRIALEKANYAAAAQLSLAVIMDRYIDVFEEIG